VLVDTLIVTGVGTLILLPSLAWLLVLFQRSPRQSHRARQP